MTFSLAYVENVFIHTWLLLGMREKKKIQKVEPVWQHEVGQECSKYTYTPNLA